jgi:hypothetical protein
LFVNLFISEKKAEVNVKKAGVPPNFFKLLSFRQESGQLIQKHADFPQRGKSARIHPSVENPLGYSLRSLLLKGEEPCPLILAHGFLNQLT